MKSVLIGMSGGVDSSVAAALLKEQGYNVIGASMNLWSESVLDDAKKVCDFLDIEFRALDFRAMFRDKVVEYFVNSYESGQTPNPCVVCNKYLKFGAMLDYALDNGIDYIATGHYAKITKNENGIYELKTSDAAKKDQTYFLYNLTQHQLSHTLMPLGEYNKSEVRAVAAKLSLPAANKPDSEDICFVEDGDYAGFIRAYSGKPPVPGDIKDTLGNVIGKHNGLIYYTIGQRKGIGAYGRPMFVMSIDPNENSITLGEKGMEFSDSLTAENLNFISGVFPTEPMEVQVKIRCQSQPVPAVLYPDGDTVKAVFKEPQRAVTPGQSAVFYTGAALLGGGTIV
ncbi:MAG: tRNA 2-thiouridine(34) synthase MnmA [Firmicutes bacterium]|nr:tRNA 2-thiouridine(34) synthase MnmA [Bacillota bacterium]